MDSPRVLIACGSGASSAFMAMAVRKAAAKRGLCVQVKARSEAEIESYIDEIDAVMLGPHLSGYYDSLKKRYADRIKVMLIDPDCYATLDGELVLDQILREFS